MLSETAKTGKAVIKGIQNIQNNSNMSIESTWTALSFTSGMANQMFELSCAYEIAKSRRSKLCLIGFNQTDLHDHVQLKFNLSDCPALDFTEARDPFGVGRFEERWLASPGSIRLRGLSRSFKYFAEVPFELKAMAWAERWVLQRGVTVGIHVRRGAGDHGETPAAGSRPAPLLYYEYCLHALRQRVGAFAMVVASDDPDWAAAQPAFAGAVVRRGGAPAEDMAVLAACRHVVSGAGADGWWAMRLAARPGARFYYAGPGARPADRHRRRPGAAVDRLGFPPSWTGVGDRELAAFRASGAHRALHPQVTRSGTARQPGAGDSDARRPGGPLEDRSDWVLSEWPG